MNYSHWHKRKWRVLRPALNEKNDEKWRERIWVGLRKWNVVNRWPQVTWNGHLIKGWKKKVERISDFFHSLHPHYPGVSVLTRWLICDSTCLKYQLTRIILYSRQAHENVWGTINYEETLNQDTIMMGEKIQPAEWSDFVSP